MPPIPAPWVTGELLPWFDWLWGSEARYLSPYVACPRGEEVRKASSCIGALMCHWWKPYSASFPHHAKSGALRAAIWPCKPGPRSLCVHVRHDNVIGGRLGWLIPASFPHHGKSGAFACCKIFMQTAPRSLYVAAEIWE